MKDGEKKIIFSGECKVVDEGCKLSNCVRKIQKEIILPYAIADWHPRVSVKKLLEPFETLTHGANIQVAYKISTDDAEFIPIEVD